MGRSSGSPATRPPPDPNEQDGHEEQDVRPRDGGEAPGESCDDGRARGRLLREERPDRLFIEPTGLAVPAQIVDTLRGPRLSEALSLRAVITLVDPKHFANPRYRDNPTYIDQLTIADYHGASILSLGDLVGVDLSPYPNVQRWYDRVVGLPAWTRINQAFSGFAASLEGTPFVGLS